MRKRPAIRISFDIGFTLVMYLNNFFVSIKKLPSPYINRFLSPDTIVPDQYNPQDLNRFSYVRNNPIRYNDPTGHMCSDPDDPTPSCDGNGGTPPNTPAPLPDALVVINNPGPLDDGQGQDDPTPTPDPIDHGNGEELTDFQLFGQIFTLFLIEVFVLMPIDYGLIVLTAEATVACGLGAVLACIADIPILAIDLVVADFQISLANTIAQNVETGTRHEFEWIIIPSLLPEVKND